MTRDETYMSRCLQLAAMGIRNVAPNPMVGAVLVHGDRVIGEGFHRFFGGPHAEIECLDSVRGEDRHLIPDSRLYVSLEPCAHHGKTPPCADRIIREGIPEVHVACRDPFPEVDGRGIERLKAAGVRVFAGTMEEEARHLNRRFLTFHLRRRPYIVLKWAESADGMMAGPGRKRMAVSGTVAGRLVHGWRSEEQAILVGSGTAEIDDPILTSRLPGGRDPLRIVIDPHLRLPKTIRLLSDGSPTLVLNNVREGLEGSVTYGKVPDSADMLPSILELLHRRGVQSVLVEGGRVTLQSFLRSGLWDECRLIRSRHLLIPGGYPAPDAPKGTLISTIELDEDRIEVFNNPSA